MNTILFDLDGTLIDSSEGIIKSVLYTLDFYGIEEIYRDLKYHVEQGDYLYSELLPSENNLIGIYDCSRNTIRRAIAGLVGDGYVQAVHGKGVQVIFQPSEKTNFTVGRIESFQETAARNRKGSYRHRNRCRMRLS